MTGIHPRLWELIQSGAYWARLDIVFRIDPATLVLPQLKPKKPREWAPSYYEEKHGIVSERMAIIHWGNP